MRVDGVAPTEENLSRQTYPIHRPFLMVTAGAPSALARAFIDFARSPAGAALVRANGAVPPSGDGGAL